MKKLKIIHTSDVHGYFYPTDYRSEDVLDMGLFSLNEKKEKNKLLFDCGDMLQGSPYVQYLEKNSLGFSSVASIMNDLNYDVVTLGNHDFNFGYENLESYTSNLKADVVSVNVEDLLGKLNIKKYTIIETDNGLKVGVIGACTPHVNVWEKKENLEHIKVHPIIESIQSVYSEVKSNCDILVLLYHGGYETSELLEENDNENIAKLISKTFDFNLILTGHQHQLISNTSINDTHTGQTSSNAINYLEYTLECLDTITVTTNVKNINKDNLNQELFKKYQDIQTKTNLWLEKNIGTLEDDILEIDPLTLMLEGSRFSDLVNNYLLEYTSADIAATSLMNNPYPLNKNLSIRNIVCAYPFSNTIRVIEVSKKDLFEALEISASYFKKDNEKICIDETYTKNKLALYNFDFYYGIDYTFDINKIVGSRVVEVLINGKVLDENKMYKLAVSDYRASGTGGYDVFKNKKIIFSSQDEIQQLLITNLSNKTTSLVKKANYKVIK